MTYGQKIVAILVLAILISPFLLIGKMLEAVRNGVAWFSKKVFKKPFFLGKNKKHWDDRLLMRQGLCPHLNGQRLVRYEKVEPFLWAKISRSNKTLTDAFLELLVSALQPLDLYDIFPVLNKKNRFVLDKMPSILIHTERVDALYLLESECYKTSSTLRDLGNSLRHFGFDTKEICKYNVSSSKYSIQNTFEQISAMTECLKVIQTKLDEKMIWLDKLVKKQCLRAVQIMFDERRWIGEIAKNQSDLNTLSKDEQKAVNTLFEVVDEKKVWIDELIKKQYDSKKLTKDEQKGVNALFDEVKQIHTLIMSDIR